MFLAHRIQSVQSSVTNPRKYSLNLIPRISPKMIQKISPRILSVQSHVVSGYCGNKSATFPLQLLQFEVDVVNTVQLSNHTQYKVAPGQIYKGEDLKVLHDGLKSNNLTQYYDYLLSGYIADADYLEALASLVKDIKNERREKKKSCYFTLDPVLGEDGIGYYVPDGPKIAETYREHLLPLADIVTPNRFEASILSGVEIDLSSEKALSQTLEAVEVFHQKGVKLVVITSFVMSHNTEQINSIVSLKTGGLAGEMGSSGTQTRENWIITVPKLDCAFTGTGDLFAALLTAWLDKTNFDVQKSLENTTNTIHHILEDTWTWYKQVEGGSVRDYELRLVQNMEVILNPNIKFRAKKLEITSFSEN